MKTVRAHGVIVFLAVIVIGIVLCCAPIVGLIICIKGLIEQIDILKYIFVAIGSVILLACGIYVIVIFLKRKIVLDENWIYIPCDIKKSNSLLRKIQHETTIRYDEIQSIYLELRCTDTNNKPIPYCVTPMTNLVFVCQDGKEKVANLLLYSDKQIIFLLDYICEKVKEINGNVLFEMTGKELLQTFEKSENEKYKKRKK